MVYILSFFSFFSSSFVIPPKKSVWVSVPCPPPNLQSNLHQNLHPNQPRLVAMLGSFEVLQPTQHKTVPWYLWVRALTGFFFKESLSLWKCTPIQNSCLFQILSGLKKWLPKVLATIEHFNEDSQGPNSWYNDDEILCLGLWWKGNKLKKNEKSNPIWMIKSFLELWNWPFYPLSISPSLWWLCLNLLSPKNLGFPFVFH